jgi:hypothetical protein
MQGMLFENRACGAHFKAILNLYNSDPNGNQ